MRLALCAAVVAFVTPLVVQTADGAPYFLLTSVRPKCVSVVSSEGQVLEIQYDAPDMRGPKGGGAGGSASAASDKKEGEPIKPEDGLDSQWNRRAEQERESAKSRVIRDMSIMVSRKPNLAGGFSSLHRQGMQAVADAAKSGAERIREDLVETKGSVKFDTGKNDGLVEICMQSISASVESPSRFSLNIKVVERSSETIITDSEGRALENSEVMARMGRLERDIKTLISRVGSMNSRAEQNKEQEVTFHEKSTAMNRAATYWPILHLVVLVITGFTQANHIVKFMKSRHIGL